MKKIISVLLKLFPYRLYLYIRNKRKALYSLWIVNGVKSHGTGNIFSRVDSLVGAGGPWVIRISLVMIYTLQPGDQTSATSLN